MAWIQIRTDVLFGPDRSTYCLKMVSKDDTSMQKVNNSVGAPEDMSGTSLSKCTFIMQIQMAFVKIGPFNLKI